MVKYLDLLFKIGDRIREEIMKVYSENPELLFEKLNLNPSQQFTRKIDSIAEKITVNEIEQSGITTYLISEELGEKVIGSGEPEIFIVLDPIDGTLNAVSKIPFFSTSIGLGKYNEVITTDSVEMGLVKDLYHDVTFWAVKNKGAYEDRSKIFPSKNRKFSGSLVSIYSYKYPNIEYYEKIAKVAKLRTLGSLALEICYVASGRFDVCLDIRGISRLVDTTAAKIILEEAGGIFCNLDGTEFKIPLKNSGGFSFIAASNRYILEDLLNLLK
ncbi:MAG: inositol monophosphatase family protein [Candidatus Odinarchaeia archaeon]